MTCFFFADIIANGLAVVAVVVVLFLVWEGLREHFKQRKIQREQTRKRREREQ